MLKEFLSWYVRPTPRSVERRVLQLVAHVWDHVPFYRERMERAGITPHDIRSLAEFVDKFPRISSAEYRAYQQLHDSRGLIDSRLRREDLQEDRSSGSSGVFIAIHRSRHEIVQNKARSLWYLMRAGLRPWHNILAVLHPAKMVKRDSILQSIGIFRRTTVNYTMPVKEIVELIQKSRIDVIYGGKSYLRLIAEYFATHGLQAPRLQLLIPGAERINESDRKLFHQVFAPVRFREFYGASETYFIASRHEQDYEVDYRAVFFSLAEPQTDGTLTRGSIVVTSLINASQPILNLDLGDDVVVRNYDRLYTLGASIAQLEGRNNDYISLRSGERISSASLYVIFDYCSFIEQFRVVQESYDHCTVMLRVAPCSAQAREAMEAQVAAVLADKIPYAIRYVDEIPMDPNGKTKALISRVPR